VFICRYLDLLWNFESKYNWIMKIIFISTSCFIVYAMKFRKPACLTYDKANDGMPVVYVIVPCFLLAVFVNLYYYYHDNYFAIT
jgi:ER lumen protein retaining receptor